MNKKFNRKARNNNKSFQNKKGNKNYRKSKEVDPTSTPDSDTNDASWYTGDSDLTYAAGRFNWLVPNGSIIDTIPGDPFTFPGVCALRMYPSVGVSVDNNSVVNVAARKMYTWIRRSKSSYATYDPSDLMQYCIAVSQAYQFHNWMSRLYGLLNVYSQLNRYIPETLLRANNVDVTDLRNNMANLLWYINEFGNQIGSLAVPTTLPYFKRQAWLYSGVYTDDQTGKSTMYEYVPSGFYIYDHANAQLIWNAISSSDSLTFTQISALGDSILSNILTSQDFWNISADILNAYGDNILSIASIKVDYLVLPTFDLEVLSQIQNAWICGTPSVTQHANDITQGNDGELLYNPRFPSSSIGSTMPGLYTHNKRIINMYKDAVTPDDVFVATRLSPTFYTLATDPNTVYMQSGGTEFVGNVVFWFFAVNNGVRTIDYYRLSSRGLSIGNITSGINEANLKKAITIEQMLSNTAYHPHIHLYFNKLVNSVDVYAYGRDVGDVANFTIMDNDDLSKLHISSLMSLFNVPTLGGFNS